MLSFFPLDVLDEIWDLIESVSEGFLTYSYIQKVKFVMQLSLFVCLFLFSSFVSAFHARK